jgi:hypothetical protein
MSSKRDILTMLLNVSINSQYTDLPRAEKSDNYTCNTCTRKFTKSVKCTNFAANRDYNYCLDCLPYMSGRYHVGIHIMIYFINNIVYDSDSFFITQAQAEAQNDKNLNSETKCSKCNILNLKGYAIRKKGKTDNLCFMCYFDSTRGIINKMLGNFAMSGKSVKKINKSSKRSQKKVGTSVKRSAKKAGKSSQKTSNTGKKRYNKSR